MNIKTNEILDFWYDPETKPMWFKKDESFDKRIYERFYEMWEFSRHGVDQAKDANSALAMIILFDQFPRNMFRNSPKAFSSDPLALSISKTTIEKKLDQDLDKEVRFFVYMPFMHSESLEDQERALVLFDHSDYAVAHHRIIARFGRFPHRNAILGRDSTAEELEFLKQPGSSF